MRSISTPRLVVQKNKKQTHVFSLIVSGLLKISSPPWCLYMVQTTVPSSFNNFKNFDAAKDNHHSNVP